MKLLRGTDEGSGAAAGGAAAAKGCELRKLLFPGADVWTQFIPGGAAPLGMVVPPLAVAEPLGRSLLVSPVPLNQGCAAGGWEVGDRSSAVVPLHEAKGEGTCGRLVPSPQPPWACGCGVGRSEKDAPRTRDWAKLGGMPSVASASSAASAFGSSALMPSPTWGAGGCEPKPHLSPLCTTSLTGKPKQLACDSVVGTKAGDSGRLVHTRSKLKSNTHPGTRAQQRVVC